MLNSHYLETGCCTNCSQKDSLLQKYEALIKLYKKKDHKTSQASESQITRPITSQDLTLHNSKAIEMFNTLDSLTKRRCSFIFKTYEKRKGQKLALITIEKIMKYKVLKNSMNMLLHSNHAISSLSDGRTNYSVQRLKQSTTLNDISEYKDCQGIQLISNKYRVTEIKKGLTQLRGNIQSINLDSLNVHKLEVSNNRLKVQVNYLKQCLQESTRRQEKQNQKKQESLFNLADDLQEKSQIIFELEKIIRSYENKYKQNKNNVLKDENDPVFLQSEIQHLQSVGNRLNEELSRERAKIEQYQLIIKEQSSNIKELEDQNAGLKSSQCEYDNRKKQIQEQESYLQKLINKLEKKLKKISICQKQIETGASYFHQFQKIADITKSDIILSFLANIHFQTYQLKCLNLFDDDEKSFLSEHKMNYLKLVQEANKSNKSCFLDEYQKVGKIEVKGQNAFEESLFSVIEKPNVKQDVKSDRQGITMKIVELEIEKSKQVSKISELKDRLMHIRVLFKKVMKSLELQQSSLQSETEGVMRVIFEMFEYSEEQRLEMFPPKKKLFGFI